MHLSLSDRVLILKQFYVKSRNCSPTLRECRHSKGICEEKDLLIPYVIRRMVKRIKETLSFIVKCGKLEKQVFLCIQEGIAIVLV